jgi:Predicted nucleic acid-binding protein, contains PIN domain
MAALRLYLDANIFIYAFENNDAAARKLLELISASAGKSPFLATSELALAEFLVDPLRRNNRRLIDIYDNLTVGNAFIMIGTVSRDVLWHAALLRSQYVSLRLPDAIHLSTALHFGCTHFLTADMRLKETYSIAPNLNVVSGPTKPISIARPDIAVLDGFIEEVSP